MDGTKLVAPDTAPLGDEGMLGFDEEVVQVISKDEALEIHVFCRNKTGLLANLMEEVERLGLMFDEMNVTCQRMIIFYALTSVQDKERRVDSGEVRQALLYTIHEHRNFSQLPEE